MREGCKREGEEEAEKNGENSGPLTSLPFNCLNGDRLQRRRLCQLNNDYTTYSDF